MSLSERFIPGKGGGIRIAVLSEGLGRAQMATRDKDAFLKGTCEDVHDKVLPWRPGRKAGCVSVGFVVKLQIRLS